MEVVGYKSFHKQLSLLQYWVQSYLQHMKEREFNYNMQAIEHVFNQETTGETNVYEF
jgi:hypothetical protein